MSSKRARTLPLTVCALSMLVATTAAAQTFPNKPIRVFTSDAGGGTDITLRLIAPAMSAALGQQVIIENRGGVIPGETVANAAPDGYTLIMYGPSLWLLQFLRAKVPFNFNTDFAPVVLTTRAPCVLVVHPSMPVKTVKELIALAKSKPTAIDYASASTGTANHLAAELFKFMGGANMTRSPYQGAGQAMSGLLSGEAHVMFPTIEQAIPIMQSGRVRGVGVSSSQRVAGFPDLPTIAESGVPGYEAQATVGMLAPAKTPAAVIARLNKDAVAALNRPDFRERYAKQGIEVGAGTPEQFGAAIQDEIRVLGKMIKETGIRDQ